MIGFHCVYVASGLLVAQIKSFIIGGHDALRGAWPWMVYLSVSADGFNKFRCGGTLLNHEWVLISASCLDRYRHLFICLKTVLLQVNLMIEIWHLEFHRATHWCYWGNNVNY